MNESELKRHRFDRDGFTTPGESTDVDGLNILSIESDSAAGMGRKSSTKRALQNREAQRNFRERRKNYVMELEEQVFKLKAELAETLDAQAKIARAEERTQSLLVERESWKQERQLWVSERHEIMKIQPALYSPPFTPIPEFVDPWMSVPEYTPSIPFEDLSNLETLLPSVPLHLSTASSLSSTLPKMEDSSLDQSQLFNSLGSLSSLFPEDTFSPLVPEDILLTMHQFEHQRSSLSLGLPR